MEEVAERACEALEVFLNSDNTKPIRLVVFTDIREEMIELFVEGMKNLVKK